MTQQTPQQLLSQAGVHLARGEFAEAEVILRQLLGVAPQNADLLHQLALLCYRQKKFGEAEGFSRTAVSIKQSAVFLNLLAEILRGQNRLGEAIQVLQSSIALNPRDGQVYYNLGLAYRTLNRIDQAIEAYREAARLNPGQAVVFNNLATAYRAQGRVGEAIENFRKALALKGTPETHSNLLYAMWFDPGASGEEIEREHREWSDRWARPLGGEIVALKNDLSPERKLRVGYVSPDFRQHVIALFMQPILERRDREGFHVTCYADVERGDFMTERLRKDADEWVSTVGMSDAQLAEKIRGDGIDVLVDLTAHMARNRMLVFARKPAPVQVSYLAYAGTTGLYNMDYRVSDPHLDPPEVPVIGPERIVYLPEAYWCYQPQVGMPEVASRDAGGAIAFVCFNHCAKVNGRVIGVWAKILLAVPGAVLRMVVPGGASANPHFQKMFGEHGVGAERIILHDKVSYTDYFSLYLDADIGLDPFPYNGGTTTLDALYMGVPVVTLAGASGMSRAGVSILNNVGLGELIGGTEEEYVEIAVGLAGDRGRLREMRAELRGRLKGSVLMDVGRFVGNLEGVYRELWRAQCAEVT